VYGDITVNSSVENILNLTEEEFRVEFKGSVVMPAKHRGLLRNAAVAQAVRDDEEAIAAQEHALNDRMPLVREAANWSFNLVE
jgi:epoxyqueuosine reductase QueG